MNIRRGNVLFLLYFYTLMITPAADVVNIMRLRFLMKPKQKQRIKLKRRNKILTERIGIVIIGLVYKLNAQQNKQSTEALAATKTKAKRMKIMHYRSSVHHQKEKK